MGRLAVRVFVSVGLLAMTLTTARAALASGEVVVSASPSQVRVGEPLEVLLRTFVPFGRSDVQLDLRSPRSPYPGSDEVWNVLYPWDDYPFDVVAQSEDGTDVSVTLARDPTDSTLWRGVVSLPKPGTWTIWVRNYPTKGPGSTTVVKVDAAPPASTQPAPTTGTAPSGSISTGLAALIAALVGLFVGMVIAGPLRRRTRS